MASAVSSLTKLPELKKRLTFTVLALAVYRLAIFITVPGVDRVVMEKIIKSASGTLFGLFNMFSGGALQKMSVLALGIMPYISSSIIMSLLTVAIPSLEELKKEGHYGMQKINQYTRYGTILICLIQGIGMSFYLESLKSGIGEPVVLNPGWGFRLLTVLTLTTGSIFVMWLGEQITEYGIGNGISLIIFAGIVARAPDAFFNTVSLAKQGILSPFRLAIIAFIIIFVIGIIVFFERAHRRIPIQYAKRVVGRSVVGGQMSHLPIKLNSAGVIPPIFASSLLMLPATLANFINATWMSDIKSLLQPGSLLYMTLYVILIVFFTFFYTAVVFNPKEVAENLQKWGGYIPGIRPGNSTAEYIDKVLARVTFVGSIYLSAVCVLPSILITNLNVPFYFGGTSLLIVVGVALDTIQQIEGYLISHHYDGFTGPGGVRIRGRKR